MNNEVSERVRAVMAKHLRIPVEQIPADATFEDLKIDSLDSVNLLFEIEDEFDISINDQQARDIKSVPEMVAGIEQLLAAKAENPPAEAP
jgi:acyl carrier protein